MPTERNRPAKLLTMSPEAWERLDAFAARWGTTRSAAAERLVRDAPLPPQATEPRKRRARG